MEIILIKSIKYFIYIYNGVYFAIFIIFLVLVLWRVYENSKVFLIRIYSKIKEIIFYLY